MSAIVKKIKTELKKIEDKKIAVHSQQFFKTKKGQYSSSFLPALSPRRAEREFAQAGLPARRVLTDFSLPRRGAPHPTLPVAKALFIPCSRLRGQRRTFTGLPVHLRGRYFSKWTT